MEFRGFHHIGLKVTDTGRSLRFYTEGLGGRLIHQFAASSGAGDIFLVDLGGNAVVEILPGGWQEGECNARWAHICLNTGDCRSAYAHAMEAGASSHIEPQDVMLGDMPVSNAFVLGPDNEVIEFIQLR